MIQISLFLYVMLLKLSPDSFVSGSTLSSTSVKNIAVEAHRDGGTKHALEVLTVLRRQHFIRTGKYLYDFESSGYKDWYIDNRVSLHPKRNGVAAVSSIINDPLHVIMCTIPKVFHDELFLTEVHNIFV